MTDDDKEITDHVNELGKKLVQFFRDENVNGYVAMNTALAISSQIASDNKMPLSQYLAICVDVYKFYDERKND